MKSLGRRLAALSLSALTLSFVTARADDQPLEIAAILSLSGPYEQVGFMEARTLDTEIKLANANGGINGRNISLHLFDDQSDTGRAYMLADRIVAAKQATAIVGGSTTPICEAIKVATAPANVVQYCLSGGSGYGRTYFTSFATPQRLFGDLPASFFAFRKLKRIAVVVPANHAGKVYLGALEPALASEGRDLIASSLVASAAEASEATERALKKRADVIYIGGDRAIEAAALRTIQNSRKKTTVWLVDSGTSTEHAELFADAFPRGPVYGAGDAIAFARQLPESDPQRAKLLSYWATFTKYNSGLGANTYTVITADAARVLISGLRNDEGVGGLPLAKAIESLPPFAGLYASYQFGPNRHNGAKLPGTIVRFRSDGKSEYVTRLDPSSANELPAASDLPKTQTEDPSTVQNVPAKSNAAPVYSNDSVKPSSDASETPVYRNDAAAPVATAAPADNTQYAPATDTQSVPATNAQPAPAVDTQTAPTAAAPASTSTATSAPTTDATRSQSQVAPGEIAPTKAPPVTNDLPDPLASGAPVDTQ